MDLFAAACGFNRFGLNVIPLTEKRPFIVNGSPISWDVWQTQQQSEADLRAWDWNQATGVAGIGGIRGLVCLDYDKVSAGLPIPPAGVFALLAELGLPLDYEWVVKTGQGYHVWLRCENLALSVGRLDRSGCAWSQTEKIELRYRGHYAVLPPSLHPSGLIYRFVYGTFPVMPPAAVSAPRLLAVYDLLTTPSPQLVPTELSLSVPSGLSGYDKWITQAIERVEKLGKGRNDTGFWLACQLRDDSYSQKEALHVLEKFRQRVSSEANPYTRQEIEKSIHSAYRRAPRSKARSNLTPP